MLESSVLSPCLNTGAVLLQWPFMQVPLPCCSTLKFLCGLFLHKNSPCDKCISVDSGYSIASSGEQYRMHLFLILTLVHAVSTVVLKAIAFFLLCFSTSYGCIWHCCLVSSSVSFFFHLQLLFLL